MTPTFTKTAALAIAALLLTALTGCASTGRQAEAPLYRCEQGIEFRARFMDDSAVLDGSRGHDVLYLNAGGTGQQTVYNNSRMRAEFGLGSSGREAIVRYPLLPLVVRCVRD